MQMKCIHCGTINSFRNRTNNLGFCKKCGHQFAFEPDLVSGYQITDSFFTTVMTSISTSESLFFTHRQFFYYLREKLIRNIAFSERFGFISKIYVSLFIGVFVGFIPSAIISGIFDDNVTFFYDSLISSSVIVATFRFLKPDSERSSGSINLQQFQELIDRWQQVNGKIEKLLPTPNDTENAIAFDPEISTYSFDAVIVCDRPEITQFLIANNFHFENNCAVLSIGGYPQSIFTTVMQMLRRNSELKVYALHDASPNGISLVHTLRTNPNWFSDNNIQIFDFGLLPRQIMKNRRISKGYSKEYIELSQQLPAEVRQSLTAPELEWLDKGYYLELEYFTPERLLRAVNRGIAKSQDPNSSDSLFSLNEDNDDVYYSSSFG